MIKESIKSIKNLLFTKDEEVIITDKTNEVMNVLKEHQGKSVKHIVKVKAIENVRRNLYEAIKTEESELTARLEEVTLARKLFESTLADLGEKEIPEDKAFEINN